MNRPSIQVPIGSPVVVDPRRTLSFTFAARTISAVAGQSIGAALYAAGVRIFTRSFKYHRPRGLLCVAGDCPNCLMQVDDRPNVRTCIEPVRDGQVVLPQNVWPSLQFDLLRSFDWFDRFLPVGFYYKRFHKPRWLWPLLEPVIRNIAGLGRIDVSREPECHAAVEHLHTDICVIGAGPAGLAAAETAVHAGARVLLLDRQRTLGGHLLCEGRHAGPLEKATAALHSQSRLEILTGAAVFGIYEGNLIGAVQANRLLKIRATQIIVCAGGRQRPFLFHNNDLPGVFLGDGVLRLAREGVRAGRRAVIVTDNEDGARLAQQLKELDIEVAAIVDARADAPATVNSMPASAVVAAVGNRCLKAVRVAPVGQATDHASAQTIACDLLCMASERVPANELLLQAGYRYRHDDRRWLPERTVPGVLAAGAAAGTRGLVNHIQDGRLRGAEAAANLGLTRLTDFAFSVLDFPDAEPAPGASAYPARDNRQPNPNGKVFVCLCEDVTEKDVYQAVAEGFDGIEPLKRYSTVSMGPCQGKVCSLTASEVCARATGCGVNAVGTTTSRPPAIPVEMGVLAADRRHSPVRRTPLHHWHQSAGAAWLDAGAWKRPEKYREVDSEVEAVRTGVGLIDVSTLGKIELVGPDAAELLERTYLNSWKDLKVGRARYGVMCTEEGILYDDGVGARLAPEHFYLTATTGNADSVVQWLEMWRDVWQLDAVVYNQTSGMAAMNLAGPHAREVLASVTELDVSQVAFPYMALREGSVAGVPCRLMRLGFVGELGYEIHCPAFLALSLWQALLAAGESRGLQPFGVEAQRILRLEKGHLIIGQDTDALSSPLDAGLERLIRFHKPVFHGREPLLRLKEMGSRTRLVGFCFPDEAGLRCPRHLMRDWEGCQVVEGSRPVGRVTSLRHSRTLGRSVGLAWVPAARSNPGEHFHIRWNGNNVTAEVAALPFYDAAGARLKLGAAAAERG
jgi:sarcosine oxidase subunit alpha